MAAYITYTILGERPHSREGTREVSVTIRALAKPDNAAAEWLLQERYPSARLTGVVVNAAHRYPRAITSAHLARVPMRRLPREGNRNGVR